MSFPSPQPWVLGAVLGTALLLAFAPSARADRTHLVGRGQTLAQIAKKYRVSVASLRTLNDLRTDKDLRQGQSITVPEAGVVIVRPGQTLAGIARSHRVSVADLQRENGLSERSKLRPGMRLAIPGQGVALTSVLAGASASRDLRRGGGPIQFTRIGTKKRATVALLDRRGRPSNLAANRLGELMRPRKFASRLRVRRPDLRLVAALARVTAHFGDRPVQIVSGFRAVGGYTKDSSRHTRGRALDFRIEGVRNETLRDFCRTLPDVGVGYYPNSSFVHLDVRDQSAYWVDWSKPGQAPRYHGKRHSVLAVESELDATEEGESLDVLDVEGLDTTKTDDAGAEHDHAPDDDQSASGEASSAPPSSTAPSTEPSTEPSDPPSS